MRIHIIAAAALGLVLAAPASAQDRPAGIAFAGCWAPSDGFSTGNRICLVPTASSMLDFVSIAADGKTSESLLSLDGRRVDIKTEECEGWEEGRLTADGERLIVKAELTCGREPKQIRETAFTITPSGHLMQATGTGLATVARAQVRIFEPVESYAGVPPTTREELMPHLIDAEAARLAVRDHPISAKDLAEFERLDVAPVLIDLLVASSYPKSFVIDGLNAVAMAAPVQGNAPQRPVRSQFAFMNGLPMLSLYDWQMMYECRRTGLGCPFDLYGYSAYGLGYYGYGLGSPYGWGGPWGFPGYGGYGGYGIPVIVRPVDPTPSAPGGRAVRGRGYTQTGTSSTGGTAEPRNSVSPATSATARTGGTGSSSVSGGSASTGSTSTTSERTAKPRP